MDRSFRWSWKCLTPTRPKGVGLPLPVARITGNHPVLVIKKRGGHRGKPQNPYLFEVFCWPLELENWQCEREDFHLWKPSFSCSSGWISGASWEKTRSSWKVDLKIWGGFSAFYCFWNNLEVLGPLTHGHPKPMGGKLQIYNLLPRRCWCPSLAFWSWWSSWLVLSKWLWQKKIGRERDYRVGLYWVFQSIWGSMILSHTQINQDSFPIPFYSRHVLHGRCHSNSRGALQELESLSSAQVGESFFWLGFQLLS